MRVTWEPRVSDAIADHYVRLTLDEQRAFAGAAERVIETPAERPLDVGESRGGRTRVWITTRATYRYVVTPDEVRVVDVHFPKPRPSGPGA